MRPDARRFSPYDRLPVRTALVTSLLVAVVVLATSSQADSDATACTSRTTGEFTITLRQGGLVRNALVHVPRAGAGRALAVVLAFHGAGGSGRSMADYSELSPLADRDHFIVVYPTAASAHHFWTLNDRDPSKPDDVGFIRALLQTLPTRACIDPERVYATGVSNGGGFAARLGCEMSAQIAAIAPVAGGYRSLGPCNPDRPVAVLEIHGTSDPVVPYDGKPPDYDGSVPRFLAGWAQRDGCPQPAAPIFVAPGTERFDWGPCAGGTEVLHLRLSGVGHTWPGGDDSRSAPIVAGRTVWRFFRGRTLSAPAAENTG
jgi:polyhydroxybutyrate depolymerase